MQIDFAEKQNEIAVLFSFGAHYSIQFENKSRAYRNHTHPQHCNSFGQ